MVSEEQQRTGSLMPVNTLMILNTLRQGRRMSVHDIAEATKIPEGKVRATAERMTESGLLETVGNGKGRAYILSAKVYRDKADYVRQTDIEAIRYQELILKLADAKGSITRGDIIDLLHVTPPQAYRIAQKMVKAALWNRRAPPGMRIIAGDEMRISERKRFTGESKNVPQFPGNCGTAHICV